MAHGTDPIEDQTEEQTTQPPKRQPTVWVPPRRTIGTAAVAAALIGAGLFLLLLGDSGGIHGTVTAGHIFAGILVLGGLEGARWSFGSQRAADREAVFLRRLDADDDRLDELFGELAEVRNTVSAAMSALESGHAIIERHTEVMEKFLAHELVVDEQSAKARGDVALILETQQRTLDLLAQMDLGTLTREDLVEQIAALREQLAEAMKQAAKDIYAAGYVKGTDNRLNGSASVRALPVRDQP